MESEHTIERDSQTPSRGLLRSSPAAIRDWHREQLQQEPGLRERDFAEEHGIPEAKLVAAYCGQGVERIESHPDRIIPQLEALGEVMALTRNASCVHEKIGVYQNYQSGGHAAMVLSEHIDLRMFPSHWQHAFAVEKVTAKGNQRSVQIFDAAGDAVHKVFLRETSDDMWQALKDRLRADNQSDHQEFMLRRATEPAKINEAKIDILRKEWARMTDTHQFMRLTAKFKMNRLGAYRVAGEPFVQKLATESIDQMLTRLAATGVEVMVFVGNHGCIQIHTGAISNLQRMGPWQNIMDPNFNLHLRSDQIDEVWLVDKPTQRGVARSIEAFSADGALIFQVFGLSKEGRDSREAWHDLTAQLDRSEPA